MLNAAITIAIIAVGALFFALLGKKGGLFGIVLAAIVWAVVASMDNVFGEAARYAWMHSIGGWYASNATELKR